VFKPATDLEKKEAASNPSSADRRDKVRAIDDFPTLFMIMSNIAVRVIGWHLGGLYLVPELKKAPGAIRRSKVSAPRVETELVMMACMVRRYPRTSPPTGCDHMLDGHS
jgi:hypothetical protein